jgi:hypothetical protein
MAHLFTNHDKYHIHKTLGFLAVFNFILRFYYAIVYGTSFPEFENKFFSCSSVLIHGLLPIASLSIHLPEKRNFTSPMIWREFRLHSILFSCRHVILTIITLLELWPTQLDYFKNKYIYALLSESLIKYIFIVSCIKTASIITAKYGDVDKRTTNAMPYPNNLSDYEIQKIKYEYAKKQFGATIMAVFSGNLSPTLSFAPLYAIQSAAFMMTLVRKGKCNSSHYHIVYALTLIYPLYLYHVILRKFYSQFADFAICYLYIFSYNMRIKQGWDNKKIWAIVVPGVVFSLNVLPNIENKLIVENIITTFLRYYCSFYLMYKETIYDYKTYRPLFLFS